MLVLAGCESGTRTLPTGPLATPRAFESAPVPDLISALQDPDAVVRLEAVKSLGARKDATTVAALGRLVGDPDPDVALAVVEALGQIGDPAAAATLLGVVASPPDDQIGPQAERYTAAIVALGKIRGPAAITRLLELSTDLDLDVGEAVTAVTDALEALGPADVPALAKALGHKDQDVRLKAIERLGSIGGSALDVLLGQLGSKTVAIRVAAAEALGTTDDRRATAALVRGLADSKLLSAATGALASIYDADGKPLVEYLKAKKTIKVYLALIMIGQKNTETALVTALDKFGYVDMAEDYLNCGNARLDKAAPAWASRHGYRIVTRSGVGGAVHWGS